MPGNGNSGERAIQLSDGLARALKCWGRLICCSQPNSSAAHSGQYDTVSGGSSSVSNSFHRSVGSSHGRAHSMHSITLVRFGGVGSVMVVVRNQIL
jgi:hypothetical protein